MSQNLNAVYFQSMLLLLLVVVVLYFKIISLVLISVFWHSVLSKLGDGSVESHLFIFTGEDSLADDSEDN